MEPFDITPEPSNERIFCSNHHDPSRNAKKYCQICKKFLCSDCLVDLDIDHLKMNKTISIDDYYNIYRTEIADKIVTIRTGKEQIVPLQKSIKNQIEKKVDNIVRQVDEFTNSLTQELSSFNDSVRVNMSKFKEDLTAELKEKSLMFKYIGSDFDVMLQELEKNLKNWDVNLRADKIKIIKDLDNLYGQPLKDVKKVVDNLPQYRDNINPIFAEKQIWLDKILAGYKLDEKKKIIREALNGFVDNENNNKFNNSDKKKSYSDPSNDSSINKVGNIPFTNKANSPSNDIIITNPHVSDNSKQSPSNIPMDINNELSMNRRIINRTNTIDTVEIIVHKNLMTNLNEFNDLTNSIKEGIDYKYIMGCKNSIGSNLPHTMYVYFNRLIHEIQISPKNLERLRSKIRHSQFPYKHSRIVNLGTTAIITGGSTDEESTDCFQITPHVENDTIKLSITEFPSMNDARERHNMIYLPKYNSVFVCSSFQKSVSTEICNLKERRWLKLRDMNTRRANSTLVFVDDRWIFCISGYIVNDERNGGCYSNSYEVFDMHNISSGWKEYPLVDGFCDLKLSAMGCINLNKNDFILLGGFDGTRYMDTTYHITTDKDRLSTIKKVKNTLDSGVIFQSSTFIRSGNSYINFDNTKLCELISLK